MVVVMVTCAYVLQFSSLVSVGPQKCSLVWYSLKYV